MKKISIISLLIIATLSKAQTGGMSCQYFPALQVGVVKVKNENAPKGSYSFGAALPVLLFDRIKGHWYTNIDLSALYYGATQTNKANDDRIKISKAEGSLISGRLGWMFGKKPDFKFGINGNLGLQTSNLDSLKKSFSQRNYINYGLGLLVYKKIGKLHASAKFGYEIYAKKNFITKGRGFYLESTIGYSIYQKYGLSVSPCFYSKGLTYAPLDGSINSPAHARVTAFFLRFGLTRFF